MSDFAIRAEDLGKRYRVGAPQRYLTFRDAFARFVTVPFRSARPSNDGHIWALKDVSFEITHGEVVGIIGRNGAGKTTLLKILSRITEPTEGYARVRGCVGSLLEVGTGFHPELTGRENVYLSGAILGMKRVEIARKFDEIVGFAELDRFIDTPVKHYSSGMQVRLAFAVAAHLEADILLVDEVLAVGDIFFQRKSEEKMKEVTRQGRTILFVSHNMAAVSMICDKIMLLNEGRLVSLGPTEEVVARYRSFRDDETAEVCWPLETAPGFGGVRLRAVRVRSERGDARPDADIAEPIILEMEFLIFRRTRVVPIFHLHNQNGVFLFGAFSPDETLWLKEYEPGLYRCRCTIPGHLLQDGLYHVTVILNKDPNVPYAPGVSLQEVVSFRVHDNGSRRGGFRREWVGLIRPLLPWQHNRIGDVPSEAPQADDKAQAPHRAQIQQR